MNAVWIDDWPLLYAMMRNCMKDNVIREKGVWDEEEERSLFFAREHGTYLAVFEAGSSPPSMPIGTLKNDNGWLTCAYVLPTHQRQGVFSWMLEQFNGPLGCSVMESNHKMRVILAGKGFVEKGKMNNEIEYFRP